MYTKLQADVAIIGGGLAGLNAAIAAAEQGARVVVMDKARIEHSGCIAGGVDHFMAYLDEGESWDTRDAYLKFVKEAAYGAVNLKVHEQVFCEELSAALERVDRVGSPMRDPATGKYYRTRSMGMPGPYWINFDGKYLKPNLAKEARRLGCQVLDWVTTTKVFVQDQRAVGVSGVNIHDGSFWLVECAAIIASTGNTNRLYETPTGMPFNTWLCPYDTGAAQALAFEAGAQLANMEYLRMTIVPKGFSAPGLNAFTGEGATFINGLGERYMERYHKLKDKAPRNYLVYGALMEVKDGRGPLFLDCRHLPQESLAKLKGTLGTDKETLTDYFTQKGIDIAKEPFEIEVSEAMSTGPIEVVGAGVKIDEQCMSTVPGLFAAGDCADQMKVVHMAITGGYAAGKQAARYAKKNPVNGVPESEVLAEQARALAPLQRKNGHHYREVEDVLRKIMKECVGPMRTEVGLRAGEKKIAQLATELPNLMAANPHELMRCLETGNLVQVGAIMAQAALARKESRFIPYHYRLDYPQRDDRNWCGQVVVWQKNGTIETEFRPLDYGG